MHRIKDKHVRDTQLITCFSSRPDDVALSLSIDRDSLSKIR